MVCLPVNHDAEAPRSSDGFHDSDLPSHAFEDFSLLNVQLKIGADTAYTLRVQIIAGFSEGLGKRTAVLPLEGGDIVAVDRSGHESAAKGRSPETGTFFAAESSNTQGDFLLCFLQPFETGHAADNAGNAVVAPSADDTVQMRADHETVRTCLGGSCRGVIFQVAVSDGIGVGNKSFALAPVPENPVHLIFDGAVAKPRDPAAFERAGLCKEGH